MAFLGLGSNLGDRGANLAAALRLMAAHAELVDVSSVWETEPVGFADQPRFWNLVVRVRTQLRPATLLSVLRDIEAEVGRTHQFLNGPREIDIDVLIYDEIVLHTGALDIPHPRMSGRAFVLRPLMELEPDRMIEGTGKTVRQHLEDGGPFEDAVPLFPGSTLPGVGS
jgi:2-amino-4-hydroxy-6-hydroxymethyldihydropteridine diphosphokinase